MSSSTAMQEELGIFAGDGNGQVSLLVIMNSIVSHSPRHATHKFESGSREQGCLPPLLTHDMPNLLPCAHFHYKHESHTHTVYACNHSRRRSVR